MQEIRGDAKSVRTLLSGKKYSVDYYQREYRWETKQVTELLEDLADKFLESHETGNERAAVQHYGHYFLGSIIVSDKDNHQYIIDGQQRLTTLTLLLIYLYRQIADSEQKTPLVELVFSQKYGRRSFNLDIPDRTACMETLFLGEAFDESGQPESVFGVGLDPRRSVRAQKSEPGRGGHGDSVRAASGFRTVRAPAAPVVVFGGRV